MSLATQTDSTEIIAIERRLQAAADKLESLVKDVAVARQIREHDSDRRKAALAKSMVTFLEAGESAAAADAKARASYVYCETMKELAAQLRSSEESIAAWDAAKTQFECSRSLLAVARELTRM